MDSIVSIQINHHCSKVVAEFTSCFFGQFNTNNTHYNNVVSERCKSALKVDAFEFVGLPQ